MRRRKQMIREGDLVYYAQLEMFDTSLVGKEGTVTTIARDPSRKEPLNINAWVLFTGIGTRIVPFHCLEKVI